MASDVSIPNRARFKPSEVCSIAGVQPYILRSWEAEFPALGTDKGKNVARVYRRADVELVLKIKSLVFGEGLTLGAARRKLEASTPGASGSRDSEAETEADVGSGDLFEPEIDRRLVEVKKGLREILDMLSAPGESSAAGTAKPAAEIAPAPSGVEGSPEVSDAAGSSSAPPPRTGEGGPAETTPVAGPDAS